MMSMYHHRFWLLLLVWHVAILAPTRWASGFCLPTARPRSLASLCAEKDDVPSPFFTMDDAPMPAPREEEEKAKTVHATTTTTTSDRTDIIKSEEAFDILIAIWDVAGDIAKKIFFAMRRTAASALTESLPEDERQELLERTFGKEKVAAARRESSSSRDNSNDNDDMMQMMSVQENVAAARVQESQRDPVQWEQEKAAIYKEAEQAANDRMETELAIQKARMDQEKKQLQQAQAAAVQEKETLEQRQAEMEAQQQMEQQESAAAVQEQQVKLAAMEEALREKDEQAALDRVKMEELAQALEVASTQAEEQQQQQQSAIEEEEKEGELPRIHAGRYTPDQWRALTDDEKEAVRKLREELGPQQLAQAQQQLAPTTVTASHDEDVHPVLGPVIQDLGYKRVHVMSAGRLGTIPIWKKQRIYRHERAKAMVQDKWKSRSLGLPGVICLHEDMEGKLSIIDGQHRVGMMMLLRDKQRKFLEEEEGNDDDTATIDFDRVLVEVYPHLESYQGDADQHAQDLFLEINKAEPIKLVDMPGVANAKDRKALTTAVDELYELYPKMFSATQRCRIPNVNVDNLRNQLYGADVMKKHKLTTAKKLKTWLLEQNERLAEKYEGNEEASSSVSPKAWKKAHENKFYLGLESNWLYN